jgi:hypothetical protein
MSAPAAQARVEGESAGALPFPSVAWFRALADIVAGNRAQWEHLGTVDCVAQFAVTETPKGTWRVQVTFDEFSILTIEEVGPEAAERADFSLEGSLATWREMIENIRANNGRPDLTHTLNYLSLPGVPMCVVQEDPVRKDCFYRFIQSLQVFINGCGRLETRFES